MILSERLRTLRESKRQSQADLQRSTGLTLAFIVSVEEGRTVPTLQILDKWAIALSVPLQSLFYDEKEVQVPVQLNLPARLTVDQVVKGKVRKITRDQKVKSSNQAARANPDST